MSPSAPAPFGRLSWRRQVFRLRGVAQSALRAWGLSGADFSLLAHGENTTFRVRSARGQFVLRIHRPGYHHPKSIQGELAWLAALRAETQLAVPAPVVSRGGSTLVTVVGDDVPEQRHCVLFHWLAGRFLWRGLGPRQLEQVGELAAGLHRHAESYRPLADTQRPRWDLDGLLGRLPGASLRSRLRR